MAKDFQQYLAEAQRDRSRFIGLIRKEEALARQNPRAYANKVRWFAYLGYGYLVFIGIILLGLIALMVLLWVRGILNIASIQILLFSAPLLYIIVRSLFVKIEPPEGVTLTRDQAPKLFQEVDAIAQTLGCRTADRIVIDSDLNAMAAQVPRFGLLGPHLNYLVLGLPLLLTLTPDEARSVIGHEFGHFSGEHGRFSGWIYRVNRTWEMLRHSTGSWLLRSFSRWYQPRFDAISFALRRQNEVEADAAAVRISGVGPASNALMRFSFVEPHLDQKFWTPLGERIKTEPKPPANALEGLAEVARSPVDPQLVERGLKRSLKADTRYADTHPSLSDRLRGMGLAMTSSNLPDRIAELSAGFAESAAEAFLGVSLPSITAAVNAQTVDRMKDGWTTYHERHQRARMRLADLQRQAASTPWRQDEAVEVAQLVTSIEGKPQGLAMFQHLLSQYPDNPDLLMGAGSLLLEDENPQGLSMVQRAMTLKPSLGTSALAEIANYYATIGDLGKLQSMERQVVEAQALDAFAYEEATNWPPNAILAPSLLSRDQTVTFTRDFDTVGGLREAYLVRRILGSLPDKVVYYLVVVPSSSLTVDNSHQKLMDDIAAVATMDDFMMIFAVHDRRRIQQVASIPNSLIYRR